MVKEDEFEKALMETIDVQLKQFFGETATSVIYGYLRTALSLRQEEIPKKLEVFSEGLDKFLSSGARVVEKVILEGVYSDLGQEFQTIEGYTFVDYLDELRTAVERSGKA